MVCYLTTICWQCNLWNNSLICSGECFNFKICLTTQAGQLPLVKFIIIPPMVTSISTNFFLLYICLFSWNPNFTLLKGWFRRHWIRPDWNKRRHSIAWNWRSNLVGSGEMEISLYSFIFNPVNSQWAFATSVFRVLIVIASLGNNGTLLLFFLFLFFLESWWYETFTLMRFRNLYVAVWRPFCLPKISTLTKLSISLTIGSFRTWKIFRI